MWLILILLITRSSSSVTSVAQHAAAGSELLHTVSPVHDDVVDENDEYRGQASVNATYDNEVAVLVDDYTLSAALLRVSFTHLEAVIQNLANLGRTLSNGEILQLSGIRNQDIPEEVYYQVIKQKTVASLESCIVIGTQADKTTPEEAEAVREFGQMLSIILQIRDDIFDYLELKEIGKPIGNDMVEGKFTLSVIHALNLTRDVAMPRLARKVKDNMVIPDEIAQLVAFTKQQGGIEYVEQRMDKLHQQALAFVDKHVIDTDIKNTLQACIDYVVKCTK